MSLPTLALAPSILGEDLLAQGVSFFMAELLSVREVVRAADRARSEGRTLLYLLDEILAAPTAPSARWPSGGYSSTS